MSLKASIVHSPYRYRVGSKYKYIEMFSRLCDLEEVTDLPTKRQHDLAIMAGFHRTQYRSLKASGTPYIFIVNDLFGMRWNEEYPEEREAVLGAAAVMSNSEDLISWMKDNYGLEHATTIHLRPLEQDMDFEPLPKLPGKNVVYAGGMVAGNEKYSYRDYRTIFKALMDAGWTVHCYPAWGHTGDVPLYRKLGCVIHDAIPESVEFYRELSQYQLGFQGYAHGAQQDYIEAARPNKLWTYLAAGIPTVSFNPGNGRDIFDGIWGVVADDLDEIGTACELAMELDITDELRYSQTIEQDTALFRSVIDEALAYRPIKVGTVARANICGQVGNVPKAVRDFAPALAYGFFLKDHKFAFTPDEHNVDPAFLKTADIIQFEVTHQALDLYAYNPNAALIAYQHGHMDRKGDAPSEELILDAQRHVTRVVSSIDRLSYVEWDESRWMPCVLDPLVLKTRKKSHDGDTIRVVHSPSKRDGKQTREIIEAVKLLQALGDDIELDIIEDVPFTECIERKSRGDICYDHLERCYGMAGVEAMYLGIPTIAGMDDETDDKVVEIVGERPYVRADQYDLALRLHELVVDPKLRKKMGDAGHRYAKKYHTPEAVAERRMGLYHRVLKDRPAPVIPLTYPVALGVDIEEYNGRPWKRGEMIDRETALGMKAAGLLQSERIM